VTVSLQALHKDAPPAWSAMSAPDGAATCRMAAATSSDGGNSCAAHWGHRLAASGILEVHSGQSLVGDGCGCGL